jgi:Tfp pilus assembly protein PilE
MIKRNGAVHVFLPRRRGLTLLELTLVLVVLAAVAGLLVPVLANMATRTHGAVGAANVNEIAKAVQMHESMYNERPNGFDSLIDEADDLVVDGGGALQYADLSSAAPDSTEERIIEALNQIGIDTTYEHVSTSTNKTFEPYAATPVAIAIDDSPAGEAATLTASGVAQLRLEAISASSAAGIQAYVAFGLGASTNMIGRSMLEAPVHFPEAGESPVEEYSRFLLIYAVPATGPARLAAVAAAHEEGLSGVGQHISEYYESQQ